MKETTYAVLLRGINVGGKNKVPMAALRTYLTSLGFHDVSTYIASGNVILQSSKKARAVQALIERTLPTQFALESEVVKVLVLSLPELHAIVAEKPRGFGAKPDTYHSDVIFLMDISSTKALEVFNPREGVDRVWPGTGVVYSQRVSALLTKSRLSKIISSPLYQSMTIRSWNTVVQLLKRMEQVGT